MTKKICRALPPTPDQIRSAYRRAGLTQAEFAEALGLRSAQTVSNWVCGQNRPRGAILVRLLEWMKEAAS